MVQPSFEALLKYFRFVGIQKRSTEYPPAHGVIWDRGIHLDRPNSVGNPDKSHGHPHGHRSTQPVLLMDTIPTAKA